MSYSYSTPILELKNISLSYGSKEILKDINLQILDIIGEQSTGQIITLLGRSGIGKSTLLKIIAGLVHPTTGEVLVGLDPKPVVPGQIGMVLQNYPLFEHRTVKSNFELVCKDSEKIKFYAEEFDVAQHLSKYPCQLSGGQRQRSAIIQQLLCSDKFILLDEPFSGLDPLAIEKLCRTIKKVANLDSENTVIISSHIIEPALSISNEVIMLDKIEDGPASVVLNLDLIKQGVFGLEKPREDARFTKICEDIRKLFYSSLK